MTWARPGCVPADVRIVQGVGLQAAEAALTGESTPVLKSVEPVPIRSSTIVAGPAASNSSPMPARTATGRYLSR